VPGEAVNVSPTVNEPVSVGVGGVANVPAATATVVAVFGVLALPALAHVTVTLKKFVESTPVTSKVFAVASVMSVNTPVADVARDH
jgi:hypothetical protein